MDTRQLAAINRERFAQWQTDLAGLHATGGVLIGFGHDAQSGRMHVFGPQEWSREEVVLILVQAAQLLSESPPDDDDDFIVSVGLN